MPKNLKKAVRIHGVGQKLKLALWSLLYITILVGIVCTVNLDASDPLHPSDLDKLSDHFGITAEMAPNYLQFIKDESSSTVGKPLEKREVEPNHVNQITIPNANPLPLLESNITYTYVDYGLCTLRIMSRQSLTPALQSSSDLELALMCSHLYERDSLSPIRNIQDTKNKLCLQHLEITLTSSRILNEALSLICKRFNCSNITRLNLSGVKLSNCSIISSWIRFWSELEVLDFSNTSITTLECFLRSSSNSTRPIMNNLTTLLLDDNEITVLDFDSFLNQMPKLTHLSLVNNSIFYINCSESLRDKMETQLEYVCLANNSISCDKSQLWLMKQFLSSSTNLRFPDYDQIKCSVPERLAEMTWSQRVSVLETHICDDCDCKSLKKTAISVDCHNKNLTTLPDILPINTKVLNLTSNRINSLDVPENSKNWENVTYVYLEDNLITSFHPLEVSSKFMKNLAALDIRRNKFQEFPSHIFEQFINLDQVHLSNNPWLCDCEPTFAFQEWLQRQFQKVGDKDDIKCGESGTEVNGIRSFDLKQRLSSRVIYRLDKSELCPQENLEDPQDWLSIFNFILGLTIVSILLKVALDYLYQHRTKRLPHFFKLNY